jgi:hypothetical protein
MKPSEEFVLTLAMDNGGPESLIRDRHLAPISLSEPAVQSISGPVIGRLARISEAGVPQVDFSGNPAQSPISARTVISLSDREVGRSVVLIFECGETMKPIIAGLLQPDCALVGDTVLHCESFPQVIEVEADGEKVSLIAQKEIVLRCGKASITLTSAGKILICGEYVLSRSSGVNRIRGGSVQIN